MRLLEVIQRSTAYLEARGVASPRLQVELILAQVLRIARLQLYLEFEREPAAAELDLVREAVRRRGQREPLQHILGSTSFCGFEIEVTPHVLIPRPETELLAEKAWSWLRGRAAASGGIMTALDWGTGTGCLAVALAAHVPEAQIVALDVSPAAIEVARRNVTRHGLGSKVTFVCADGAAGLPIDARFDLVVGNPPYIPTAEIATLEPEVRDHDPPLALDGGPDGLEFYRRMAVELQGRVRPGGVVMLEFGYGQAAGVSAILEGPGWKVADVHRDDTGRERYLVTQGAV